MSRTRAILINKSVWLLAVVLWTYIIATSDKDWPATILQVAILLGIATAFGLANK